MVQGSREIQTACISRVVPVDFFMNCPFSLMMLLATRFTGCSSSTIAESGFSL